MECQKSIKKKKNGINELLQLKFNNTNIALSENQNLENKFKNKRETNLNLTCFEEGDTKVKKPRDQGGGTHISNQ